MIVLILIVLLSIVIHNHCQVLQINCSNADNRFIDQSVATCADYILQYLNSYTTGISVDNPPNGLPNQGYDPEQIPLSPSNSGPTMFNQGNGAGINVYALIELVDMVSIDTSQGVVVVNVDINLLWSDFRLAWNSSLTPNIPYIYIDSSSIWTPDITLYNQAAGSTIQDAPIQLSSTGMAWFRRQSTLIFNCNFQLKVSINIISPFLLLTLI